MVWYGMVWCHFLFSIIIFKVQLMIKGEKQFSKQGYHQMGLVSFSWGLYLLCDIVLFSFV